MILFFFGFVSFSNGSVSFHTGCAAAHRFTTSSLINLLLIAAGVHFLSTVFFYSVLVAWYRLTINIGKLHTRNISSLSKLHSRQHYSRHTLATLNTNPQKSISKNFINWFSLIVNFHDNVVGGCDIWLCFFSSPLSGFLATFGDITMINLSIYESIRFDSILLDSLRLSNWT